MEVEVLGTKFNVNAYEDEDAIKTTLVEGSVRVSKGIQRQQIRPGQQAQVLANDIRVSEVDVDKIVSWKNGAFSFKNDNLYDALNDIARWYDVEVVYEGNIKDIEITGMIDRNSNLSEFIKVLSLLKIDARIEGRNLILKTQ